MFSDRDRLVHFVNTDLKLTEQCEWGGKIASFSGLKTDQNENVLVWMAV